MILNPSSSSTLNLPGLGVIDVELISTITVILSITKFLLAKDNVVNAEH